MSSEESNPETVQAESTEKPTENSELTLPVSLNAKECPLTFKCIYCRAITTKITPIVNISSAGFTDLANIITSLLKVNWRYTIVLNGTHITLNLYCPNCAKQNRIF